MALPMVVTQLRKRFRGSYSTQTANIIKRLARGQSTVRIASVLNLKPTTVATTKGNLTRGTYAPFAVVNNGKVVGSCLFAS